MSPANASQDLLWQVMKKNNSFLKKAPNGLSVRLTSEPGNLMAQSTFKHSGLANDRALGVVQGAKGPTLVVKSAKAAAARKPSKMFYTTGLKGNTLAKAKFLKNYRPDLAGIAKVRGSQVKRAVSVRSGRAGTAKAE